MLNTTIKVSTENFDGPLSLLLYLIRKEEMSLDQFDLRLITAQYLNYLKQLQQINFNLAGDYLLMAAILIYLKSKSFIALPVLEELSAEIDIQSTEQLTRRLEALQHYQKMGLKLHQFPKLGEHFFTSSVKLDKNIIYDQDNLQPLLQAMAEFILRCNHKFKIIKKDPLSIKKQIDKLKDLLKKGIFLSFDQLTSTTPGEKLINFISLLELAKLGKVQLWQESFTSPLHILVKESVQEDDFTVVMEENQ